MRETEVNFKDKQGGDIVGTLLIPDGNGPFPAVIVCHGFRGDQGQTHITQIAQEITRKGMVTLRFDFTHDPGVSSLSFEDMTISYELEVLAEAINFIKSQKEIDPERVGLTGHSLGGLVVSWYAASNQGIKALVPLSAVYNFPIMWRHAFGEEITREMQEKGFAYTFSTRLNKKLKIKLGFYNDAENYDMDKMIENLSCPILVIAGTADEAVTLEHAQHFYDRARSQVKELKIIKGSDHNYTNPGNLEEVKTSVADWFAKVLLAKAN